MSGPMWDMTGAQWMAWFRVWEITPWTDGEQLTVRPASGFPLQYRDLVTEAKPRIIAHLIETRDARRQELDALTPQLQPFEETRDLDNPAYVRLLGIWNTAREEYEAYCVMAPEPAEAAQGQGAPPMDAKQEQGALSGVFGGGQA